MLGFFQNPFEKGFKLPKLSYILDRSVQWRITSISARTRILRWHITTSKSLSQSLPPTLENIVVSVYAKAHPLLLIFSLFALPSSRTASGRAQSPLRKTFKHFFGKRWYLFSTESLFFLKVLTHKMSLCPWWACKGGARAARATLIIAVYYLNVRVWADIDVFSSPHP